MNVTLMECVLAFAAGVAGSAIGGTQTFVLTGLVGLISAVLATCGIDTAVFDAHVLNLIFLPAVIFNGAGFATAYAAKHHEIRGFETGRSLAFTGDVRVFLMGGLGALLGWLFFSLMVALGLPADQGAITVCAIGVLGRILFNQEQHYNLRGIRFLQQDNTMYWLYLTLFSGCVALLSGYFGEASGLYTIGFSVSAFSLVFCFFDPYFPATHQITIVAGYAMMYTHNLVLAVVMGIIAEVITDIFGRVFNTECGTHIDPPAVAIFLCSLFIFTVFG